MTTRGQAIEWVETTYKRLHNLPDTLTATVVDDRALPAEIILVEATWNTPDGAPTTRWFTWVNGTYSGAGDNRAEMIEDARNALSLDA